MYWCRWKAIAAYDPTLPGLVMFGCDAAQKTLPHKGYLNDMWWLPTNESLPVWAEPVTSIDDNKKHKKEKTGVRLFAWQPFCIHHDHAPNVASSFQTLS